MTAACRKSPNTATPQSSNALRSATGQSRRTQTRQCFGQSFKPPFSGLTGAMADQLAFVIQAFRHAVARAPDGEPVLVLRFRPLIPGLGDLHRVGPPVLLSDRPPSS